MSFSSLLIGKYLLFALGAGTRTVGIFLGKKESDKTPNNVV
ncbi:hypothetical protein OVS_03630 [Mycoplasma ovis str. Michigan]|uniref:Fluoride ion transporter CrcB n=1 Tax=Mycoplasma ovis str. Michigan TaxID=1415773 RepID=A0ABM5P1Z1_9MOLU|nr:hypothetical protein [Mycoplasma ovis]AHC40474.1 hypothetical protein OVS_03630 [Mycoplasma ovis str. Michigan]